MKKIIGCQGEITIVKIDSIPDGIETRTVEKSKLGWVIAHSESGNHHCLTGGDVMERTSNVPAGMQILYGILDEPKQLIQDTADPHESFDLDAGLYEFRIAREYDPFEEEARRVAD